ncbi:MAG: hypothetical protein EAX96_00185 [Candidatus Lokiarchaeota archaeon]|nr:hypothetical protein [Candidatus Lokiarchaeota archaeon]
MNKDYIPIIAILFFWISGFLIGGIIIGGQVINQIALADGQYAGTTILDGIQGLFLLLLEMPVFICIVIAIKRVKNQT